jgi:hypothetical protein
MVVVVVYRETQTRTHRGGTTTRGGSRASAEKHGGGFEYLVLSSNLDATSTRT